MTTLTHFRRVIRIRASDSPNVRVGLELARRGIPVPANPILPGVLPYEEYLNRLATWDEERKCVGLDAEFYQGKSILMYPPEWLDRAHTVQDRLTGPAGAKTGKRRGSGIGVDPAEGGDSTALCCVDEHGLLELLSLKTPDTAVIPGLVLDFMRRWDVPAQSVYFDRGGGGKQHADLLRANGYDVQSVGFGEGVTQDMRHGLTLLVTRKDVVETRYVYLNRRAEMYSMLRDLLDPSVTPGGWGLPRASAGPQYKELRRQLAPLPRLLDREGRVFLPPKKRKDSAGGDGIRPGQAEVTITDLIGCSPDEADALALACYAMCHKNPIPTAGVVK